MAKKRKTKKPISAGDGAAKVPGWGDLPLAERRRVAARLIKTYVGHVRFAAGRYNLVSSAAHRALRERPQIEIGTEDDALTASLRAQFVNLGRNAVRNNETLNGILEQLRNNAVGVEGGKAYFDFGDEYAESAAWFAREFRHWTRSCEFFDGTLLNEVLKIILQTIVVCGDCAVAIDTCVDDSGTLMVFEPDSIMNYPEKDFKMRFPNHVQVQGRIKNRRGVFVGICVSSSERGKGVAEKAENCLLFTREPHADPLDVDWITLGPRWRSNQGRGTPQIASPLESLLDTADLLGFEKESAKKNSQMYAQLIQTAPDGQPDESTLGDPAANPVPPGEQDKWQQAETAEDVAEAVEIEEEKVTFDELVAAGAFYDIMPANSKLELLDTKHPNPNMNEFIRLVECRGGWALGLCACFVTGKVDSSYTGFRGEMLMSWPTFQKWQKLLERFCDWVIVRWFAWMEAQGRVPASLAVPEDWADRVTWFWPAMKEVNPVDMQNAWTAGLKNGTMLLAEINGPDWKEKARRHAEEVALYRSLGLVHPADETASGQVVGAGGETETETEKPATGEGEEWRN